MKLGEGCGQGFGFLDDKFDTTSRQIAQVEQRLGATDQRLKLLVDSVASLVAELQAERRTGAVPPPAAGSERDDAEFGPAGDVAGPRSPTGLPDSLAQYVTVELHGLKA
eukprot:12153896-Prorocentrum_lima.AAC.1